MNRICFGMPTLLECPSVEDSASLCRELGLDFIELNQNLPDYQADSMNLLHIRNVLEQYSLFATLHLDENLNPFDFQRLCGQSLSGNCPSRRSYCEKAILPGDYHAPAPRRLFYPSG